MKRYVIGAFLYFSVGYVLAMCEEIDFEYSTKNAEWEFGSLQFDIENIKTSDFTEIVDVSKFGVVGDGKVDDTSAFQRALNWCSERQATCKVPRSYEILITEPIFIWGDSNLIGEHGSIISISLRVPSDRYVVNLGLSSKNMPEKNFEGVLFNLTFKVLTGPEKTGEIIGKKIIRSGPALGGRIIKIWRSSGAEILGLNFEIGPYMYAAMGTGSNNTWLANGQYVRNNLLFRNNRIIASSDWHGMEGVGLTNFDGALLAYNDIEGVGDDVVGLHRVKNINIFDNHFKGVDGRLLVASSSNIIVSRNRFERHRSDKDKKYHPGQSLINIGALTRGKRDKPSSKNIYIDNNHFLYPDGASDNKGSIYLREHECVSIINNTFENNSLLNTSPVIFVEKLSASTGEKGWKFLGYRNNRALGLHAQDMHMRKTN